MAAKAQQRYDKLLSTKQLSDGRTVYQSVRPSVITTDEQDVVISADENDRSDIIANNVYGSALDWWRIAAANGRVNGSLHFTPGQQVIIPRKK